MSADLNPSKVEEFLSVRELSARVPYSEGSIRNMISRGEFVRGVHYVKPNGRVVFVWSRVVEWFENEGAFNLPSDKGKR